MNQFLRPARLISHLLALGISLSPIQGAVAQSQQGAEAPSAQSNVAEEENQTELLRSYIQLREQLHATQMAVANSRVEAETAARMQAAALNEKLDAIKTSMDTERERQLVDAARLSAERASQEAAMKQSQRTFIWVASIFGALGVLALLLVPFFQWRALSRVIDGVAARTSTPVPLPAPSTPALALGALDQAVELSNQRLMSVIDRVEQRVMELEHTATQQPVPSSSDALAIGAASHANGSGGAASTGPSESLLARPGVAVASTVADVDPRISLLLGKGRQMLSANRAREALSCYDEILKINPEHAEALVRKGSALERLKRDEEAIWCYDRAIEADRKLTLAFLYKGGVYNRLGRYDDALRCYEQALHTAEDSA